MKGAFTGAINRGGLFEQANGGTLFLDDLVLLSNYFIQELNRPLEKNITGLHPEVISAFKRYAWPGNIGIFSHENIEVELEKEDKISPPCPTPDDRKFATTQHRCI